MSRNPFAALAVVTALCAAGMLLGNPSAAEAQCLNRTACKDIKAEVAKLKPDLRKAKQQIKKARREFKSLEAGSDRWLAKRTQLKRLKKAFKSLKRELGALKQDFRHQACSSC